MMNVEFSSAKVHIRGQFLNEGSVKAGTVRGRCEGVEMLVEVESDAPASEVKYVLQQAENGCYAMQALRNPVDVHADFLINGDRVAIET